MITLDKQIEQADAKEDLKVLLRQIVAAINALENSMKFQRRDIVFKDQDKGPVTIATDGKYYRMKVAISSGSPTIAFTELGDELPKEY